MSHPATVLIVTYTMNEPAAVVGVFFRALRVGFELRRRGFRVVVSNCGEIPEDPKVDAARGALEIYPAPWQDKGFDAAAAAARFATYEPDLVIFGEGPFDSMIEPFRGAKRLGTPFVLLDQYYQDWLLREHEDIDLALYYGLRPFVHEGEFTFGDRYRLLPPFIAQVSPREELPLPETLRSRPLVTVLGFDAGVLRTGLDRLAALPEPRPAVLVLNHDPDLARHEARARGLPADGVVAPGLLPDASFFGAISAARVVVLANGYMQILEALALATPALCIDRGLGLDPWAVEARYRPYVSIGEDSAAQMERLRSWLAASPFEPELAAALAAERNGASLAADAVGDLLRSPADTTARARRRARIANGFTAVSVGSK